MEKKDILKHAKVYFAHSKELEEIFATEDLHFFYKEIQAKKYANQNNVKVIPILRADLEEVSEKKLSPRQLKELKDKGAK